MFKKVLMFLFLIVVGIIVLAAVQPTEFEVSRKLMMAAPASEVFAQVNDLHNWEAWSPWAKLDPAMKKSYEGASSGVDSSFTWVGNNKVGEGRTTIMESYPGSLVRLKLEFLKPFKDTMNTEFSFEPHGEQTLVRWNMYGNRNFLGKVLGVFMNCDKIVGSQFEQGLASLKSIVEK